MNIPIPSSASTAAGDFFFRTADRMRVEGCVNAVAHEGMSLALSCVHEALLDHYVQLLLQRLRSTAPEHGIEVYFPANTESMIARFNEVLATQSVRQATRSGASSTASSSNEATSRATSSEKGALPRSIAMTRPCRPVACRSSSSRSVAPR